MIQNCVLMLNLPLFPKWLCCLNFVGLDTNMLQNPGMSIDKNEKNIFLKSVGKN